MTVGIFRKALSVFNSSCESSCLSDTSSRCHRPGCHAQSSGRLPLCDLGSAGCVIRKLGPRIFAQPSLNIDLRNKASRFHQLLERPKKHRYTESVPGCLSTVQKARSSQPLEPIEFCKPSLPPNNRHRIIITGPLHDGFKTRTCAHHKLASTYSWSKIGVNIQTSDAQRATLCRMAP